MKKRKLLAVVLVFVMTLSLLPTAALADESDVGDGNELKALFTTAHAGEPGSGNVTITLEKDYNLSDYNWSPLTVDGYNGAGVVTVEGNSHTISGLNNALFAGGFAGNSGIVIKNLTLSGVSINDSTEDQGLGAFIKEVDSMPKIELDNCHLIASTIVSTGGARVGGLIGWTAGYDVTDDGPVDTYVNVKNCSVERCSITAAGSVGGIIGHAGANSATYHTIQNCTITDTTLHSTDDGGWRVGIVVGTANVGEVTISGTTESGNTVSQINKTAPEGQTNLYGRFVHNDTGKLIIDGTVVAGGADVVAMLQTNAGTRLYGSLAEAIAAATDGDTITILKAAEGESGYKLNGNLTYSGKAITIKAADGVDVKFDMSAAVALPGAKITFEGVTFNYNTNGNYIGIQHADTLVYNNCTINGQVFLYAASETFNDCTFNQDSADAYNVWTYGAKKVTFNNCVFNSAGKSVLIYNEGGNGSTVDFVSCALNATNSVKGKAAIEIDSSLLKDGMTFVVNIDGQTTSNGFATGNISGNTLWNEKKNCKKATVTVSDEKVWPMKVAEVDGAKYETLAEAIAAAKDGQTVTLLADAEFDWGGNSYENSGALVLSGKTIVGKTGKETITFKGYGSANPIKNLTLNNLKVKDLTVGDNEGAWEHGYLEFDGLQATGVVFVDRPQFNGTCALTKCTFTGTEEQYGAWINSGKITFIGCEFNGVRSLKIHEAYGSDVESVTVDGCTFETTKKPGVVIGTLNETTTVTIKNSTFTDCPAGDQSKYIYESDTDVSLFHFLECGNTVTVEGATISSQEHIWDAGVVTTQPTYSAPGVRTYTCTMCGTTKTETIAQLVDSSSTPTPPSQPTTSTETKPDGSTTTTESKPDGTVTESNTSAPTTDASGNTSQTTTETSTGKDGVTESKTETVTKPDGSASSTTESTTTKPDGTKTESTTETTINKDGSTASTTTSTTTGKDGTVTESKTEATTSTVTNADGSTTETKQETTTTSTGSKTESTTVTTVNKDGSTTATTTATTTDKTGTVTESKTESTTNKNGTTTEKTTTTETKANGTVTESKTETTINTDGSTKATTTATTTKADGTKVESKTEATTSLSTNKTTGTVTETKKETTTTSTGVKSEGTTVTQIQKDGTVTSTETVKASDSTGTTATKTTTLDAKGDVTTKAEATVSAKAATEAAKTGEAVTIPVDVTATKSTVTAPVVNVKLPATAESVKVELPVQNVTPGTVAVIVKADGTEQIVKTSIVTENGVALNVEGGAQIKLVDNSVDFNDSKEHWASDEIDFATSRELFKGTSDTAFTPEGTVTRGMLFTVMARFDDADVVTTGANWYADSLEWAKTNNVSDGTNPTGNITREQLATMLYRYVGEPAVTASTDSYADAGSVSDYAAAAMQWAVENGLINGINGRLQPQGYATRAQLAAIMQRFCANVMF